MNKTDLFFARNMWLTYVLGFVIVPFCVGMTCGSLSESLQESLQYSFIAGIVWGLYFMPKIKKYKEFNNQKQMENSTND